MKEERELKLTRNYPTTSFEAEKEEFIVGWELLENRFILTYPLASSNVFFQCFSKIGTSALDLSSGFRSHKSSYVSGFLYPFHASPSNQTNKRRERNEADSSGQDF